MDAEEDDFEEEGVEVVAAEEEEMDILDDDWLIPDGFFNYWTVLYCLSIIEQYFGLPRGQFDL